MTAKKKPDPKGFPRAWQAKFLGSLAESGNVSAAARVAGVSRELAYQVRKESPDFAQAWQDALETALDSLEQVAWDRAKEQSDTLLIFLLKHHRPKLYNPQVAIDLTSKGESIKYTPEEMVALAQLAQVQAQARLDDMEGKIEGTNERPT